MKHSALPAKETNDGQIIEAIKQLQKNALGAGAATCHLCGTAIPEGRTVVAYTYCPAGARTWRCGTSVCTDHEATLTDRETWAHGVHELVVRGRVGRCVDQATQSSQPVLLDPTPEMTSPAHTTDAHPIQKPEARDEPQLHPTTGPLPTHDDESGAPGRGDDGDTTHSDRTPPAHTCTAARDARIADRDGTVDSTIKWAGRAGDRDGASEADTTMEANADADAGMDRTADTTVSTDEHATPGEDTHTKRGMYTQPHTTPTTSERREE